MAYPPVVTLYRAIPPVPPVVSRDTSRTVPKRAPRDMGIRAVAKAAIAPRPANEEAHMMNDRLFPDEEEVTRLKTQLEEANKIRKQYKEKEDQCERLQDEVTSLKNGVNEKDTTKKEFKDRTSYCEGLEAVIVSLKEDLENSNKQNDELLQAFEEQEDEILKLRQEVEEERKVEEIMKK